MQLNKIKLSDEHKKLLGDVKLKQAALETFAQYVMNEGQRRALAVQEENQKVWERISGDLGLDTKQVEWVLAPNGDEIIPARLNLS